MRKRRSASSARSSLSLNSQARLSRSTASPLIDRGSKSDALSFCSLTTDFYRHPLVRLVGGPRGLQRYVTRWQPLRPSHLDHRVRRHLCAPRKPAADQAVPHRRHQLAQLSSRTSSAPPTLAASLLEPSRRVRLAPQRALQRRRQPARPRILVNLDGGNSARRSPPLRNLTRARTTLSNLGGDPIQDKPASFNH